MKRIAVTYDNGEIFQHFGHSEFFKIYDTENGEILRAEVYGSNGQGHGALAGLLNGAKVDAIICGGIGPGAVNALESFGIEVVAGRSGDADAALKAYLRGELVSTGSNCSHHGEGHSCEDHSCGSGCCH